GLARRLFGTTEGVVGQTFRLNYTDFRVCGVVRSASYLTSKSYAQLYVPYSVVSDYREPKYGAPFLGAFSVTFLVENGEQGVALRNELKDIVRRENLANPDDWQVSFWEQPTTHLVSIFQEYVSEELDVWATVRQFLLVLLVLLLVPALNLSGMIASRMEGRLPEMGVRKSFGAGRGTLFSQVMWENLLLTLLGGMLGLLLAWVVLYAEREWVFTVLDDWADAVPEGMEVRVAGEMLFAPLVFLAALLLCVLLNLLSALLPAWNSLRKPIVSSLNEKR
ncbi:MAG: ABC transporter permease, partial [Bacteroides sp.]|nr:ABC transporter permease [Bacteroides sp.]